jgi:hypothetical protein
MSSANVEGLIKEGIRAYRAKNKAEARALFEKASELDQYSEQAWLWLSAVVDTEEDQRVCLENVLFINPENVNARKGLAVLQKNAPPPPEPTLYEPPTATSSASTVFAAPEASPQEYDEMIAGLNLKRDEPVEDQPSFVSSVFTDNSMFGESFTEEFASIKDDVFEDPFAANTPGSSASTDRVDSSFLDDDDGQYDTSSVVTLGDGPFAVQTDTGDLYSSDSLFSRSSTAAAPAPVPATPPAPKRSTGMLPPARSPEPAVSSSMPTGMSAGIFSSAYEPRSAPPEDIDPGEYLREIPKEIKPTRLPGVSQGAPLLLRLFTLILLAANLAAIGFLIIRLMG